MLPSLTLSRFCPQILSFLRFCLGSPANPMIPEDHGKRDIPIVSRFSKQPALGLSKGRKANDQRRTTNDHAETYIHA